MGRCVNKTDASAKHLSDVCPDSLAQDSSPSQPWHPRVNKSGRHEFNQPKHSKHQGYPRGFLKRVIDHGLLWFTQGGRNHLHMMWMTSSCKNDGWAGRQRSLRSPKIIGFLRQFGWPKEYQHQFSPGPAGFLRVRSALVGFWIVAFDFNEAIEATRIYQVMVYLAPSCRGFWSFPSWQWSLPAPEPSQFPVGGPSLKAVGMRLMYNLMFHLAQMNKFRA